MASRYLSEKNTSMRYGSRSMTILSVSEHGMVDSMFPVFGVVVVLDVGREQEAHRGGAGRRTRAQEWR